MISDALGRIRIAEVMIHQAAEAVWLLSLNVKFCSSLQMSREGKEEENNGRTIRFIDLTSCAAWKLVLGWGKHRRGQKKLTIIYRNLSSHAIQLEASSRTAWREMSSLFPLSSYFVLHPFEVRKSLCLSSLPSLQRRVQEWLVFVEYVVVRTRSYMYPLLLRRPLSLGCDSELPIHLWGTVWRYLRASSPLGRGTNGISGGGVQACLETTARTRLDEFGALWFAHWQSTRFAGLWYVFRLQGAIWEAIGRLYCDHGI